MQSNYTHTHRLGGSCSFPLSSSHKSRRGRERRTTPIERRPEPGVLHHLEFRYGLIGLKWRQDLRLAGPTDCLVTTGPIWTASLAWKQRGTGMGTPLGDTRDNAARAGLLPALRGKGREWNSFISVLHEYMCSRDSHGREMPGYDRSISYESSD